MIIAIICAILFFLYGLFDDGFLFGILMAIYGYAVSWGMQFLAIMAYAVFKLAIFVL